MQGQRAQRKCCICNVELVPYAPAFVFALGDRAQYVSCFTERRWFCDKHGAEVRKVIERRESLFLEQVAENQRAT